MAAVPAADWVVVDDYALDARWHACARNRGASRIAAIDDLADRPMAVNLLIDPNERSNAALRYANLMASGGQLLSGVRYALLEPEYRRARRPEVVDAVRSIGVFMGGGDQLDVLQGVLTACRLAFAGPIEVAATSAQRRLAELRDLVASDGRMTLSLDLPSLVDFHSRHDLHIGAAGAASWERCCVGAPAIAIPIAHNQEAVAEALAAHGASEVWSGNPRTDAAGLASIIALLAGDSTRRTALSAAARTLIDGRGAERIALFMLSDRLSVRAARLDDCSRMMQWRNDCAVRSVSNNAAAITPEAHRRWFSASLEMPTRLLSLATSGRAAWASCASTRRRRTRLSAVVSIYLDPSLAGIGLGSVLLREGERALRSAWPSVRRIDADVLADNRRSRSMFHRAGYHGDGATLTKVL